MRSKGFTLIELLAVIVILAIIALIATPIILGIINDAREQSKHRTAELIAKEIELAYSSYLFKNNGVGDADNFCTYMTNDYFAMDNGEIVTEGEHASNCDTDKKVTIKSGNDYYTVTYANGIAKVLYGEDEYTKVTLKGSNGNSTKPRYYSLGSGTIGGALPSDASQTKPQDKSVYLALESEDETTVSSAYVCFVKEGKEYCLKGYREDLNEYDNNTKIYNNNKSTLDSVFPGVCESYDAGGYSAYRCNIANFLGINIYVYGSVTVNYDFNPEGLFFNRSCLVEGSGDFTCY